MTGIAEIIGFSWHELEVLVQFAGSDRTVALNGDDLPALLPDDKVCCRPETAEPGSAESGWVGPTPARYLQISVAPENCFGRLSGLASWVSLTCEDLFRTPRLL